MSHETLASAWSALTDLQDLTAGLRDTIGNSTLRAIRSSYDPEETPRRFLEYSHELSLTFDAVRFLSRIDSNSTPLLQEDLVSAIAHFLNGLANDCVGDQTVVKDESHRLILGHAFCSAVATLRTCAWDCRAELRTVICRHAGKLLTNAPVKDDSLWLFQTLANLLLAHYASATPLGQGGDQSKTRWKMLWEAPKARYSVIQDMVKRAADVNVASADRILPMLDLCQLYWDTDALLVQVCAGLRKPRWLERVFYVPSDVDAITLAMEVRFLVQEQFAVRSMSASSGVDKLQAQMYTMFRPGLRLECVSDVCKCSFDAKAMHLIADARSKQNNLLRSAVVAAYNDSPAIRVPHEFVDKAFETYAKRLRRWSLFTSDVDQLYHDADNEGDTVAQSIPARPRLQSSCSVDETSNDWRPHIEVKARSISQPNIHRRYSRPSQPPSKGSEWQMNSNAALETQVEESQKDETEPHVANAHPDFDESLSGRSRSATASAELDRNGSTTSASSSTDYRMQHSQRPSISAVMLEKELDYSYPEAVHIIPDKPLIAAPEDFEKSYPEVVIDPVTAIQEDNLSLFSDGGSVPVTTRSGGRTQSQKRFGFFKGGKKSSTQFAVPTVRFFASGKNIIAWTRYGGVCMDVNAPTDESKIQAINTGDIVLGVGGARRYAVVARYQEAYTMSVYNLGDNEPGMKVNLGSCPKAMDMSKNDQYLAIKYAQGVRIFDLQGATKIDHKLPKIESTSSPPGAHLVAFSHDSQSFMASTRMGPEKVVTYWAPCMDKSQSMVVQSKAPCGNIDDHGLTSLGLAGPAVRGIPTGFLSTFTEKGSPVILSMNPQEPHAITVRGSKDSVGTRIHSAGMYVDPSTKKSDLVMVNQNNDIFWVTDLFGRGQEIQRLKSLKRAKSMKPELLVAMPTSDEANIIWIDQKLQCGYLIKVGKSGGMTKPVEIRFDIEPMCSG